MAQNKKKKTIKKREDSAITKTFKGMKFTKERKTQFMKMLGKCGSIPKTCKALHVSEDTIGKARKRVKFETRIQNAFERYGNRINDHITKATKQQRIPFGEGMRRVYLANVAETGLKMASADRLGVSYATVKRLLDSDKEFDAEFRDALARFHETIESEIMRRGRDGYDSYINAKNGKLILVKKFSDKLLLAAAKRHMAEWRQDQGGSTQSISAGVLVVNNVYGNLDEKSWINNFGGDRSKLDPIDIIDLLPQQPQQQLLPETIND